MTRLVLILTLLTLTACSGSQEATRPADPGPVLNIEQPPSGPLSDAQLASIAADIRQLEARPLAAGAEEGRRNLFMWIQGSPDVTVTLCGGVIGPLLESESQYTSELLTQFILSSAAHRIENPGADKVAVNVGGLEGALVTHQALIEQQGREASDAFMESIAERSRNGALRSFVRSGLADC